MKKATLILGVLLVLFCGLTLAENSGKWINIHVEDGSDDTKVDVRVPLSLIAVAMDCVQTERFRDGKFKIDFDREGLDIDFKKIWEELRKHDNTEFVKVESANENVLVSRQGDLFIVKVMERYTEKEKQDSVKTKATIKIPVKLVDTVLSASGNELDLKALISELDTIEPGNLVEVQDDKTYVKIWIE